MIELTTGVAFLVSSLYGGGQVASPIIAVANADQAQSATSTTTSTSKIASNAQKTSVDTSVMQAYLREEFGDKDAILVDVARCESNFHQFDTNGNVIRGIVDPEDVGVMQINEKYQGPTAAKLGYDIYTVEGNVAYAKHLYEQEGSTPWNSSSKCWTGDIAKE